MLSQQVSHLLRALSALPRRLFAQLSKGAVEKLSARILVHSLLRQQPGQVKTLAIDSWQRRLLLCGRHAGSALGQIYKRCKYDCEWDVSRRAACRRVGGAFGGKVARSMPVAAAAAVAAAKTGRRVRYSLSRNDDMRINGGQQGPPSHVMVASSEFRFKCQLKIRVR